MEKAAPVGRGSERGASPAVEHRPPSPFARDGLPCRLAPFVVGGSIGVLLISGADNPVLAWPMVALLGLVITVATSLTLETPWRRLPETAQYIPLLALVIVVVAPVLRATSGPKGAVLLPIGVGWLVVAFLSALLVPWTRLPRQWQVVPPLTAIVALAVLRQALGLADAMVFAFVVLVLLWLALYHERFELILVSVLAGALFLVTLQTDPVQTTITVLQLGFAVVIACTVESLVRHRREEVADVTAVADIIRRIATADAGLARRSLCDAAAEVCGARGAVLFEPTDDGWLEPTAAVDGRIPDLKLSLAGVASSLDGPTYGKGARTFAAVEAFHTGRPVFHTVMTGLPAGVQNIARASGSISALAQPVVRDGAPVAVLTMSWDRPRARLSNRIATIAGLFATEAAIIMRQADLLARVMASEEQNREAARVDPLTAVPNRRAWDEELPRAISRARREQDPLCIAVLDLDNLKMFNDDWGHQRGDRLLRQVASEWSGALRDVDLIARYGGDEFAVILPGCGYESALAVLGRVRAVTPESQTSSVGLACWDGKESAEEILARADAALYEAKRAGRDRVVTAATGGEQMTRAWEDVLSDVLENREIASAYQPILRLSNRSVLGFEALARPSEDGPEASVEAVFAAAGRLGYGRDLDWLCRRAALDGARDIDSSALLFINVGGWALLDPVHPVDQMELLVQWADRSPASVVLEISEREVLSDVPRLVEVLAFYRDAGFRFAIDDVGEGYSTLEVLAAANPEFIKIGRSLIQHPGGTRDSITRAIVSFARSAGAAVIAEGLETSAHVERAAELGADYGQGWALGRPRRFAEPVRVAAPILAT